MPLIAKKSVLAAKIETTAGTAIAVTASDAAFNAYNVSVLPEIGVDVREGQSAMSKLVGIPTGHRGTCSFEVDLADSAAWADILLPACGLLETTSTWAPSTVSTNFKTLTVARYLDGRKYFLAGVMLNAEIRFVTGQPVRVLFTGVGVWQAPIDATILAPTYPLGAAIAPAFKGSTMTIGAYVPRILNFTFNLNNEVTLLEDATAAGGYLRAWIADRAVGGTIDPEADLVATYDTDGIQLAATEQAFSLAYATTVTLAMPKMQFVGVPLGERGGAVTNEIEWRANRSAAAGDDEFSLEI